MKILMLVFMIVLFSGCGNQVRQSQLDYDKMRLEIYRANQVEQNAIRTKELEAKAKAAEVLAEAIKVICLVDGNPGLCLNSTIDKSQASAAPAVVQAEPMPQPTPVAPNRWLEIAANLTGKVLDVGLAGYGIKENSRTARYGIDANKDLILGLTDNIGRNAGTHLGNGSNYYNGNYTPDNSDHSDHSVDNSVSVGRDQTIAGGDMDNSDNSVTVGRDQTLVGDDQLISDGSIAIGDANFNRGRIGSPGPYVECSSGNASSAPGGNGGSGTGSPGGASGMPGTGMLNCGGGG